MKEQWNKLRRSRAVWQHPGDIRAPHVVLRSGKHSDGFIDTLQYLSRINNLIFAAADLSDLLLLQLSGVVKKVDWVFGSPMAGIPFATTIAPILLAGHIGFTEKKGDKELICRFEVAPGSNVLLIEEMTTTGGTPQRGIDAILAKNPGVNIIPYVGAFLTRCVANPPELRSAELISVISLPEIGVSFHEWEPSVGCPLCSGGSRAITNCKRVWGDLLQTMDNPEHPVPQL